MGWDIYEHIQKTVLYPFYRSVYFDAGTDGDSLELTFSLIGTSERLWNILVTQMACTDPWR